MKSYQEYVELGKAELSKVSSHQVKICGYAMKVVTITQGGLGSKKFYTIKDYANDIGMNHNTLSKWLEVYNDVYSKLDTKGNEKENWQRAHKINKQLKNERAEYNRQHGTVGSKQIKQTQDISADKIAHMNREMDAKPFLSEFTRLLQQVKTLRATLDKRDLGIIQDASLLLMMQKLDESSDMINDHLTNKQYKFGA